jgi:predicted kinase
VLPRSSSTVAVVRNRMVEPSRRAFAHARLVLLNGVPGSGKSTLARLYAERHPLTLALDLDVLRSMLGGWLDQPTEAGLIARRMAIEAARAQLVDGRDVIVPQYLGRLDFVLELEQLARKTRVAFIEIALRCDPADAAGRFQRRSAQPETSTHVDAAQLLDRSGGLAALHEMSQRLQHVLAQRPRTVRIESVDGQIERTYDALAAAVDSGTRDVGARR